MMFSMNIWADSLIHNVFFFSFFLPTSFFDSSESLIFNSDLWKTTPSILSSVVVLLILTGDKGLNQKNLSCG